jgi:hypothetical protein
VAILGALAGFGSQSRGRRTSHFFASGWTEPTIQPGLLFQFTGLIHCLQSRFLCKWRGGRARTYSGIQLQTNEPTEDT